jgi:hypothetical protein
MPGFLRQHPLLSAPASLALLATDFLHARTLLKQPLLAGVLDFFQQ